MRRLGIAGAALLLLLLAAPAGARQAGPALVSARAGDLYVAAARITETAAEDSSPDWSPDYRRIAFSRQEARGRSASIFVVRRDGGGLERLTRSRDSVDVMPAWSFDGRRIAFARSPVSGGSFDVYVVDARGGVPRLVAGGPKEQVAPRWTAAGRLVFTTLEPGEEWPDPAADAGTPSTGPRELLPDLDQRSPYGLTISGTKLGFASATDNVGLGPIWVRGFRLAPVGTMAATQLVRLSDGEVRAYPVPMRIRYTPSPSHTHWHLLGFQRYELRRASDFALVVRDRKSGFCLADHYGLAARRVANFTGAHFHGNCAAGDRGVLAVEQGTSPGYTDLYPAHFHGQNLELAGVPAGIYVLVHRANPTMQLEELDYTNNAASLRIALTWRGGSPHVETLRTCQATEAC